MPERVSPELRNFIIYYWCYPIHYVANQRKRVGSSKMPNNYISKVMQQPHSIYSSNNFEESSNEMSLQDTNALLIKQA